MITNKISVTLVLICICLGTILVVFLLRKIFGSLEEKSEENSKEHIRIALQIFEQELNRTKIEINKNALTIKFLNKEINRLKKCRIVI